MRDDSKGKGGRLRAIKCETQNKNISVYKSYYEIIRVIRVKTVSEKQE